MVDCHGLLGGRDLWEVEAHGITVLAGMDLCPLVFAVADDGRVAPGNAPRRGRHSPAVGRR